MYTCIMIEHGLERNWMMTGKSMGRETGRQHTQTKLELSQLYHMGTVKNDK